MCHSRSAKRVSATAAAAAVGGAAAAPAAETSPKQQRGFAPAAVKPAKSSPPLEEAESPQLLPLTAPTTRRF